MLQEYCLLRRDPLQRDSSWPMLWRNLSHLSSLPWRILRYISPKRRPLPTRIEGIASNTTMFFTVTTARNPNLNLFFFFYTVLTAVHITKLFWTFLLSLKVYLPFDYWIVLCFVSIISCVSLPLLLPPSGKPILIQQMRGGLAVSDKL